MISHTQEVCKLKSLGLSSNVICWIEGFLSNRRQRVVINGTKSEWSNVTSGVPQGSVLGPILFLVFVADITEVVESDMILFADDTKLYRKIESEEDSHILQRDIDNLYLWSKDWLMEFNKDKCKTIHSGHGNQCIRYNIDETILNSTVKEKDLGVIMSSDLKPSAQCVAAANKGMSALRQATRTFKHINIDSFKILYKTYIRPNLEFCISAWCPYMSKDIDVMEKVQRRATRMVPELKHLKYEDRLKKLEIYHLSARRLRGDLTETYKLLNNFTDVPFERFFRKSSYLSTCIC